MLVDIRPQNGKTLIAFKAKDLTTFDDILDIACAVAAGQYCFEAGSLLSPDFRQFVDEIKPRIQYGILVGHDPHGKPLVRWGKLRSRASSQALC
uniref:Uncharacterized protein n=1 Tax=uncultured prokaryote TaxID=198431 RepID=A0A0H5Q7C2_9ZZZZ|nr:hypothetical protein [uncultured prokaryote]